MRVTGNENKLIAAERYVRKEIEHGIRHAQSCPENRYKTYPRLDPSSSEVSDGCLLLKAVVDEWYTSNGASMAG